MFKKYGIRFTNQEEAEAFIQNVAKEVSDRLRKINKCGRSITLKIMVRDPEAPVEAPKVNEVSCFYKKKANY